jgi:hypothetical protein
MTKKKFFIFFFIFIQSAGHSQTLRDVYDEIICNQVKYPEIVLRQAILESGWMKSKFFRRTNNLFGFKTRQGYMKYDTWQAGVLYYYNWQQRHYTDTTQSYTTFLKQRRYARNMSSYFKKLNSLKVPNFSGDTTHTVYLEPEPVIGPEPEVKPGLKHITKKHHRRRNIKGKEKPKHKKKTK